MQLKMKSWITFYYWTCILQSINYLMGKNLGFSDETILRFRKGLMFKYQKRSRESEVRLSQEVFKQDFKQMKGKKRKRKPWREFKE